MDDLMIVPAAEVDAPRLHAAFGCAFADYLIGPFRVPLEQWPLFLGRQGVDLAASRVALRRDEVAAFCLVAPRPALGRWRLATMGALPAARGSGAAPQLLADFIRRAAAAGMPAVELECFAQNERALRLYRGRGFEVVHALYGYQHAGAAAGGGAGWPVALEDAFAWLDARAAEDGQLPLQVTPVSLRALPVELQAWRKGSAQVVFSQAAEGKVTLHSLVDGQPSQEDAQALVAALMAAHAGCGFAVPQLQRHDLGGAALERLGFERLPLHQVLMIRHSRAGGNPGRPH